MLKNYIKPFLQKKYRQYFFCKNIFSKKQNGFVLLMVMLLISSLSLIVVSVFYKVYTTRKLTKTFLDLHEKERLLKNAISLIVPFISGKNLKQEESKKSNDSDSSDKNYSGEKNEEEKKDEKDKLIESLEIFWKNFYQWKTLDFKEENSGAEGKVHFYLMCENGKIPLRSILELYFLENEKAENSKEEVNKDKDEKKLDSEKESKEEEAKNESNDKNESGSDEKSEKKKKKIFENKKYKIWQDFFEKNFDKSSVMKNYTKELKEDKVEGKNFLKKLIEDYFSYEDKIYPTSLWFFFGNKFSKKNFYRNFFKNKDNAFISELLSVESNKISPYFLSPYFLQMFSGEKFEINIQMRTKFLEQLKEFSEKKEKNFNMFDIENFWNNFYQKNLNVPYQKDFFESLKKNNLLDFNYFMQTCTAIICCESKFGNLTAIVVFEKITSSGKNDKEYLIKQIFFL